MNTIIQLSQRLLGFAKRNSLYITAILLIASLATIIGLGVSLGTAQNIIDANANIAVTAPPEITPPAVDTDKDKDQDKTEDPTPDPEPEPQAFILPSSGTITNDFALSMVWNSTLEEFSTHNGVDFAGDDLSVVAVLDGTVSKIGYDALNGNYVVLTHDNGYETGYYSLENPVSMSIGDKVNQSTELGKMSTSMASEANLGAHLHFEVTKNGEFINPLDVLALDEK